MKGAEEQEIWAVCAAELSDTFRPRCNILQIWPCAGSGCGLVNLTQLSQNVTTTKDVWMGHEKHCAESAYLRISGYTDL